MKAQKNKPANKDWVKQIESDKKEFGIDKSDEQLKAISKYKFKRIIKKAAMKQTINYLNKIKEKHSKLDDIVIDKFKPQEYLTDDRININQVYQYKS